MPALETVRVHPKNDRSTVVVINKSEYTAEKYDLAAERAEDEPTNVRFGGDTERAATQDSNEPTMDMSRDELVTLAEGLGITVSASENKHELIAEIKKANRAAARKAA
jgi:hypothetical protein